MYPKVEQKICIGCRTLFKRNKNYFGIMWVKTKYCSSKCFGKIDGKRRIGMDETKHARWKGNAVGYYGLHDWITKHYGQPKECEVCGLNDPKRKYHWANLTNYKRDRVDWKRMCVSCHRLYDYGRANKKLEITS